MIEIRSLSKSITKFSEEIFVKKSSESRRFTFLNSRIKLNDDLQIFSSKNVTEPESEEIIDTLDVENLRSLLKAKCRALQNLDNKNRGLITNLSDLLNEEKEKNNEMRTIIRLQKKEREQNNKYMNELQKELLILKEKQNITKPSVLSKVNTTPFNFDRTTEGKEINLQKHDYKDFKIENIEHNVVTKKWSFDDKKIVIKFQDLEIKFKKIDLTNSKVNVILKKEFRSVDVEIYNTSDSALSIEELNLDSTSGKL